MTAAGSVGASASAVVLVVLTSLTDQRRFHAQELAKCYRRRWEIESFISGLKRTTGSALLARTETNLLHEAALRVLAYTLNRR